MANNSKDSMLEDECLKKLQEVLLEMLIEIDRVCRKNNIKYTLIGGTLLGAVRHGGFIPWDDDVDVCLLRGEYEKFRKACETDLDKTKYFFQDNTTDPEYRWGYGKLRRKNSEFVRAGQEHLKMQTGIFIDVFPSDNVPDFYPLRLIHAFCCFCCRKILYSETGKVVAKKPLVRALYKLLSSIPHKLIFNFLEQMYMVCNSHTSLYLRTLTFPTPKGGVFGFRSEWYINLAGINFEGHTFLAIRNYNAYLKHKYGDYMTLPPLEKRRWHPASKIVLPDDVNISEKPI